MGFNSKEKRRAYQKRYWARPENAERKRKLDREYVARNREKIAAYLKAYRAKLKTSPRWAQLSAQWRAGEAARKGWLPGEWEKAIAAKRNALACACCGSPSPRTRWGWQSDHDHETGLFRGILCNPCNVRLGIAEKFGLSMSPEERIYTLRME